MLEIVDFYINEGETWEYYPMARLSDGRKYYLNYKFAYCEWYYRDKHDQKNDNVFILTKNRRANSFHDICRYQVDRFLSNFKKDVFYNQFRSGCTYTMKPDNIRITEFSELIRLLRMAESSGEQSRITFIIDNDN